MRNPKACTFCLALTLLLTLTPAAAQDADADGVPDSLDNCPAVHNPGQADSDLPPPVVYSFDQALDADGDPAPVAQYLNNDVWLAPDDKVRFERQGMTWAKVDGVLRMERDAWWNGGIAHSMFLVHQTPLPEHFVMSVDDLYRTYPYSGVTLGLSVFASASGAPPRLADMAHYQHNRFWVRPDMYWAGGVLGVFFNYFDTSETLHFWYNGAWGQSARYCRVIEPDFDADFDVRYEIVKDDSGYRARILRLDTGEVAMETAAVPLADTVLNAQPSYAVLGTYSFWISWPYVTELDDWTIRPLTDGGDACDLCPESYDPSRSDQDGDGVGDVCDACPTEAAEFDADADGCPDRLEDLGALLAGLGLPPQVETPLAVLVDRALASMERGNETAAVHQLQALLHKIEAQRGKKIPAEAADLLASFVENVIHGIG